MENCYRTAESVKESGGEKEASQQHRKCYTVDDICEMLGISKNSVYTLIKKNEFRTIQVGRGAYRIVCSSFDAWLAGD